MQYGVLSITNILLISPTIPDPDGIGLQRRAAAHLRALASRHSVSLLITAKTPLNRAISPEVNRLCHSIHYTDSSLSQPLLSKHSFLATLVRSLINGTIQGNKVNTLSLVQLARLLEQQRYDTVFCFRLHSAMFFLKSLPYSIYRPTRRIVDFDDIESRFLLLAMKYCMRARGIERSLIELIRTWQTRRMENTALKSFDIALVCSKDDQARLLLRRPKATIEVVPNGVRVGRPLKDRSASNTFNMLFVGTMDYGPNEDAVQWFCAEVLPVLRDRARCPCRLMIVGASPSEKVRKLASDETIEVAGRVADLTPYYEECDIVLAPIRYGGGTRIKILEAMSFGRPVISTTMGAEGIEAVPGHDIVISDTIESYTSSCLALMNDRDLRRSIGQAGWHLVHRRYSFDEIDSQLLDACRLP